jgi:outer membrane biosynthesis protein TonB
MAGRALLLCFALVLVASHSAEGAEGVPQQDASDVGEDVGRRAGGFLTSAGSFTMMGGGNRAGNDEALKEGADDDEDEVEDLAQAAIRAAQPSGRHLLGASLKVPDFTCSDDLDAQLTFKTGEEETLEEGVASTTSTSSRVLLGRGKKTAARRRAARRRAARRRAARRKKAKKKKTKKKKNGNNKKKKKVQKKVVKKGATKAKKSKEVKKEEKSMSTAVADQNKADEKQAKVKQLISAASKKKAKKPSKASCGKDTPGMCKPSGNQMPKTSCKKGPTCTWKGTPYSGGKKFDCFDLPSKHSCASTRPQYCVKGVGCVAAEYEPVNAFGIFGIDRAKQVITLNGQKPWKLPVGEMGLGSHPRQSPLILTNKGGKCSVKLAFRRISAEVPSRITPKAFKTPISKMKMTVHILEASICNTQTKKCAFRRMLTACYVWSGTVISPFGHHQCTSKERFSIMQ